MVIDEVQRAPALLDGRVTRREVHEQVMHYRRVPSAEIEEGASDVVL